MLKTLVRSFPNADLCPLARSLAIYTPGNKQDGTVEVDLLARGLNVAGKTE